MKKKMFTTGQISAASYLGGPIASIYMLHRNFSNIGNIDNSRNTIVIGSLLICALLMAIPFIPDEVPNALIPAVYMIIAATISEKRFPKKNEIFESEVYEFRSNWKVVVISIVCIIAFLALILPVLVGYEHAGYISLDE